MPLHAAPLSRRSFLAHSAALAGGLLTLRSGFAAEPAVNPSRFALLSDTHIPSSPDVSARGVNMTANMRQVVQEVVALPTKPAGVIVNGDCAYLKGLPQDYANFAECVTPLREAGLPLHVTMGNHDDRDSLYAAMIAQKPENPVVQTKFVTVIESPHANWFLLDSLTEVNVVTGEIGEEQRSWLAKALTQHADKPAIVMAHHTPQFEAPPEGKPWGGLKDTAEFLELLNDHPQVKLFVFGHSHDWSHRKQGNLHLLNLPPVAYVFGEGKPNGWVLADIQADQAHFDLKTLDPRHSQNGERVTVIWS